MILVPGWILATEMYRISANYSIDGAAIFLDDAQLYCVQNFVALVIDMVKSLRRLRLEELFKKQEY